MKRKQPATTGEHRWPSCSFSCKTRRNIKFFIMHLTQRWLFNCSSSVFTSHVRLCCCSTEDDLVKKLSALSWKTDCTSEWTVNQQVSWRFKVVLCPPRISARLLMTFLQKPNGFRQAYLFGTRWKRTGQTSLHTSSLVLNFIFRQFWMLVGQLTLSEVMDKTGAPLWNPHARL